MQNNETKQIAGKDDLARDLSSGAVINTNRNSLELAKASLVLRKNNTKRLDVLEEKMDMILGILQKQAND